MLGVLVLGHYYYFSALFLKYNDIKIGDQGKKTQYLLFILLTVLPLFEIIRQCTSEHV